jgi:hypothetical protein
LIAETEDQSSLIKSSARGYILTDEGSRLLVDMRLFDQLAHDPNGPSVNIDPKYVIVEVLKRLGSEEQKKSFMKSLIKEIESMI